MDGSSTGGKTSTSHVALEAALQAKPNILLLTEEIDEKRMSLREVVQQVADILCQRAEAGKNFGTVVVAEGLLSAIPEFRTLIAELEAVAMPCDRTEVLPQLTTWSRALFESLPEFIQSEMLLERQSNAVLQLSQLETERLVAALVEDELAQRKKAGKFKGSFSPVCQFLGYQARCSMPSDFDSDYAYSVGGTAAALAASGSSGYMAVVSDLSKPTSEWKCGGVPFTAMMIVPPSLPNEAVRPRPAIFPTCVDLHGAAWKTWMQLRSECAREEMYENPGPIQFSGESAGAVSLTIKTKFSYLNELAILRANLAEIQAKCQPGCDPRKVRVASQSLATLNLILDELTGPLANIPMSVEKVKNTN
jgi:diphosphate--fructose-6-phosphate 1-phosphotransferase